jgi:thymidylate kinase
MLIAFSGMDGAGKSTQIELLHTSLTARGLTVEHFWHRPGYSRELDALRAFARRGVAERLPTAAHPQARERAFRRPGVSIAWILLALADLHVQYALKLRVMLQRSDVVICDRYLADAELDLALRFPQLRHLTTTGLSSTRWLCPTPDLSFLLMIPFEEMERRLAAKQEPFPEPPEARRLRWQRYSNLSSQAPVIPVDASHSVEEVHESILERLPRTLVGEH